MAAPDSPLQPRIQAPGTVRKGDVFEVRTLVSHPMETGLRHDPSGRPIPRDIVKRFTCRLNGAVLFSTELHEAMAANPYLAFHLRAAESGTLQLEWETDDGVIARLEKPLTVES